MKRVLLIGGGGFVGGHLISHLQSCGIYDVAATHNGRLLHAYPDIEYYELDLLNPAQMISVLEATRPDYIVHLAAQSSVARSWEQPTLTVEVNIAGTVNLLEAIRATQRFPRLLLVGSGEEYGAVKEDENPLTEEQSPHPGNIYAATKVCQNMFGAIYAAAYEMDIVMVRAFNHVGPHQTEQFVVADFCRQVALIEQGLREPVIYVGNLASRRDFTDVRDVVRAYALLLEKGTAGELYNVGSGNAISIEELLHMILDQARCPITVRIDAERFRPVDVPLIEADISKLVSATGWTRQYTLASTIRETLDYWRENVRETLVTTEH